MPKNTEIRKVLVIGSGPIIIGQAAEFDYAGTQACRALKEEGVEVVLLNSNPATIMTDKDIALRLPGPCLTHPPHSRDSGTIYIPVRLLDPSPGDSLPDGRT